MPLLWFPFQDVLAAEAVGISPYVAAARNFVARFDVLQCEELIMFPTHEPETIVCRG